MKDTHENISLSKQNKRTACHSIEYWVYQTYITGYNGLWLRYALVQTMRVQLRNYTTSYV